MEPTKTAADVERLLTALRAEREARRNAERSAAQLRAALLSRVEALESRPAPTIGPVLSGLAEIRRDLEAQLAELRAEVDDLHSALVAFTRQG